MARKVGHFISIIFVMKWYYRGMYSKLIHSMEIIKTLLTLSIFSAHPATHAHSHTEEVLRFLFIPNPVLTMVLRLEPLDALSLISVQTVITP